MAASLVEPLGVVASGAFLGVPEAFPFLGIPVLVEPRRTTACASEHPGVVFSGAFCGMLAPLCCLRVPALGVLALGVCSAFRGVADSSLKASRAAAENGLASLRLRGLTALLAPNPLLGVAPPFLGVPKPFALLGVLLPFASVGVAETACLVDKTELAFLVSASAAHLRGIGSSLHASFVVPQVRASEIHE